MLFSSAPQSTMQKYNYFHVTGKGEKSRVPSWLHVKLSGRKWAEFRSSHPSSRTWGCEAPFWLKEHLAPASSPGLELDAALLLRRSVGTQHYLPAVCGSPIPKEEGLYSCSSTACHWDLSFWQSWAVLHSTRYGFPMQSPAVWCRDPLVAQMLSVVMYAGCSMPALQLNSLEVQSHYQTVEFLLQHKLLVFIVYEENNLQK